MRRAEKHDLLSRNGIAASCSSRRAACATPRGWLFVAELMRREHLALRKVPEMYMYGLTR